MIRWQCRNRPTEGPVTLVCRIIITEVVPGLLSATPEMLPAEVSKKKPGPTVSPVAVLVNVLLYQLHVPGVKLALQVVAGVAVTEFNTQPAPNDGITECSQLLEVWL